MVHLDDEEKGILKYLGRGYDEAVNLKNISHYLRDQGYNNTSLKDMRDDLDHLIKSGYIRSKTEGKGSNREEKFYLARFIGGGEREKRKLQGRGVFRDLGKLIERLSGAFFLLFGLGVVIYGDLNVTGAAISNSAGVGLTFIFAFALMIIGGVLLIKRK